mmetsp:Transcript_36711/g.32922  ORF Transcript_36711/g.32922 Transcript_36711/m.32922 type:complete len:126 (+) Transcript_36711:326-703(+)
MMAGAISTRYGRAKVLIIADLLALLAFPFLLISNINYLIIGRALIGFSGGLNSVICLLYMSEMTPKRISWLPGYLYFLSICLGMVITFLFGLFIPRDGGSSNEKNSLWKTLFVMPCFMGLARLIL